MNNQTSKTKPKLYPPIYFLLGILLMIVLHLVVPGAQLVSGWSRAIGILPILLGLLLAFTASRQFRVHETTIIPFKESSSLVTNGVFAYSRNPIYLGMLLVQIGIGLALGSLVPFIIPALFFWIISTQFIAVEEGMLEANFGQVFLDYKAEVRRWI